MLHLLSHKKTVVEVNECLHVHGTVIFEANKVLDQKVHVRSSTEAQPGPLQTSQIGNFATTING